MGHRNSQNNFWQRLSRASSAAVSAFRLHWRDSIAPPAVVVPPALTDDEVKANCYLDLLMTHDSASFRKAAQDALKTFSGNERVVERVVHLLFEYNARTDQPYFRPRIASFLRDTSSDIVDRVYARMDGRDPAHIALLDQIIAVPSVFNQAAYHALVRNVFPYLDGERQVRLLKALAPFGQTEMPWRGDDLRAWLAAIRVEMHWIVSQRAYKCRAAFDWAKQNSMSRMTTVDALHSGNWIVVPDDCPAAQVAWVAFEATAPYLEPQGA